MKFSERRGLCKNLYPEDAMVFCGRWLQGPALLVWGRKEKL